MEQLDVLNPVQTCQLDSLTCLLLRGDRVSVVSIAGRAGRREQGVRASPTGRTGIANGEYPKCCYISSLRQSLQNKTVASINSMYICLPRTTVA